MDRSSTFSSFRMSVCVLVRLDLWCSATTICCHADFRGAHAHLAAIHEDASDLGLGEQLARDVVGGPDGVVETRARRQFHAEQDAGLVTFGMKPCGNRPAPRWTRRKCRSRQPSSQNDGARTRRPCARNAHDEAFLLLARFVRTQEIAASSGVMSRAVSSEKNTAMATVRPNCLKY